MTTILIALGALLIITGIIGSFLPVLPGTSITYCGLLTLQLALQPFSAIFLIVWALIVAAIMILDNVVPAYGTKKFGGSAYGIWGSIIGLVVGIFFFPPFGLIIGPLVGAFTGELLGGQSSDRALKSAVGSFAGLLANTLMKVIASGIMGYYYFINVF